MEFPGIQVKSGMEMMQSRVTPLLDSQAISYKVHVLAHATSTAGIADIIGKKAMEIGAHSISMAHHHKTMVQVCLQPSVRSDDSRFLESAVLRAMTSAGG
jgi:hypothetical protein